ncbi:MAG: hypothetical protein QOK43_1238 [Acidimicrobiaceae bacterium]|nr:hypothetical protein [Acidimicrobiaceae bacterium]MDQ1443842.1 hypothetical protein [Acidimicrobiaceae bacterium]
MRGPTGPPTIDRMGFLLAAKVWHYWLSFAIFGTVVLVLIAYGIGYLVKVTSNKYPKQ